MAGEFVSDVKEIRRRARAHLEEEHADDLRNLIERLGGDAKSEDR